MAEYDLGTARGKLELDASGVVKGVGEANASVDSLDDKSANAAKGQKVLGTALLGVGVAAAAGFAVAVKSAADFEKELSNFKAVSGATGEQLDQIRDKALQLGADTVFSAGQAAEAMTELGKQGLSTTDILNGAADATVYLAAAGEVDLPRAATIAANAMNQFQLSAEELPHVADLLAGAANASATDVTSLGDALAYVGPVAHAAGLSIDDTTTAIAVLANNGIDGQKAGTALRGILSDLSPTSKKAAEEMKNLGLITKDGSNAFFDATGKIKPMNEIVDVLRGSFGKLTKEQQINSAAVIFGREQMAAVLALAGTTEEQYQSLADTIGNTSAQDVANEKLNNLSGSWEQLTGSVETFLIKAGTPFLSTIRLIVDSITGLVNWLSTLDDTTLTIIGTVTAVVAVLGTLVGTALIVVSSIEKIRAAMTLLNASFLTNPVFLVIAAIAALAAGLVILYKKNENFRNGVDKVWSFVRDKIGQVVDWVKTNVAPIIEHAGEVISTWGDIAKDAVETKFLPAFQALKDKVGPIIDNVVTGFQAFQNAFNGNGITSDGWVGKLEAIGVAAKGFVDGIVPALDTVASFINDKVLPVVEKYGGMFIDINVQIVSILVGTVLPAIIDFGEKVANALVTAFGWFTDTAAPAIADAFSWILTKAQELGGWFSDNFGPIFTALGELVTAIVKQITDTWNTLFPVFVGVFNVIKAVLTPIIAVIAGIIYGFIFAVKWAWQNWGDNLWNIVQSIFSAIKGVIEGVLQVIQGIIQVATGLISGDWGKAWDGIKNILAGVWDAIWAIVENALGIVRQLIGMALDLIKSIWETAWNFLFTAVTDHWQDILNFLVSIPGRILSALASLGSLLIGLGFQLINGLSGGILQKWVDVQKFFLGLGGTILGWIGDLGSTLWNAGVSLIKGFIDGIGSMFGDVKDTLGNLTDKLTSWKGPPEKDEKILHNAGQLVMQGFVDGLMEGAKEVKATLQDIAPMMQNTFTTAVTGGSATLAAASATQGSSPVLVSIDFSGSQFGPGAADEVRDVLNDPSSYQGLIQALKAGKR